ncbi:hypothetical protein F4777DRAFT_220520 [Nemania sp. FL0916]|nr:hypothetical protein F4777DRAFT_220520 [Nemania sp. FL0916]
MYLLRLLYFSGFVLAKGVRCNSKSLSAASCRLYKYNEYCIPEAAFDVATTVSDGLTQCRGIELSPKESPAADVVMPMAPLITRREFERVPPKTITAFGVLPDSDTLRLDRAAMLRYLAQGWLTWNVIEKDLAGSAHHSNPSLLTVYSQRRRRSRGGTGKGRVRLEP